MEQEKMFKCNCSRCNTTSSVNEYSLLPGRNYIGFDEDLLFYVKCPNCLSVNIIDYNLIPNDTKLKLMKQYSNIADDVLYIWKLEAEIKQKENEIEKTKSSITQKLNARTDDIRLFEGWYPSEEIIAKKEMLLKKTIN